jgi:hypothetical protein
MLDAIAARLMSVLRDPMRRATPRDVEAEA